MKKKAFGDDHPSIEAVGLVNKDYDIAINIGNQDQDSHENYKTFEKLSSSIDT